MRWILAIVLTVTLGSATQAETPEQAIPDVIQRQIDAFLQDDFDTAFTFASPGIKRFFGTPERFGAMVRQGYPMVWRPADVQYLELETLSGQLWQRVMITDAAGRVHFLGYQMVETPEGWQINGVRFLQPPELGA